MAPDDAELLDLALSICDGGEAAWDRAQADAAGHALQDLERIAAFHRSLGAGPAVETWGRLHLLERLGSGTRGEVWKAWDPELKRDVALKLLRADKNNRPELLDALLEEGRTTARVRHENIVTIHAVERHADIVGLSMEYIEGSTLSEIVDAQGPMSAAEAAVIGRELCGALGAIHRAGLLHCDVKAQNVMRQVGGRIALMDFSSSGSSSPDGDAAFRNSTSGTPLYMAPEFLETGTTTPATDIYALGITLFFLTTGAFPFTASTLDELKRAHRLGRRRHLRDLRPELPAAFVDAVEAAIDPDPARRPSTAGALERLLAGGETKKVEGGKTWRIGAWAAAATFAVASLVGWQAWRSRAVAEFQVNAQLFRTHDGTTVPVVDGDRFALGDTLHMRFTADEPSWLYVLNEDDAGRIWLLYPARNQNARTALAAGVEHRIPTDEAGGAAAWKLDEAGGHEQLLVIASPRRLVDLEADLLALDTPAGAEVSESARRRLRGFGQVVSVGEDRQPEPASGFVGRTFQQLGSGPVRARGVFARRLVLAGPNR
jgi:tRNA A-37 threonylcarbamoyl transferase component Bud32